MADMGDDKVNYGCAAWIDNIRGNFNNRLEKARSRRRVYKEGKKCQPLTSPGQMTDTSGDATPIVARKQDLCPRSPVVDMKEDIHSLHTMIASLDGAKSEVPFDRLSNCSGDLPWTDIDVDKTVWEILRKASRECEDELTMLKGHLASSPTLTSGLSSCPSLLETIVGEPLTVPSDDDFDRGLDMVCKQIEQELQTGAFYNEVIEVAE